MFQFSHFTDENPEAHRGEVVSLSHTVGVGGTPPSRYSATGGREPDTSWAPLGRGLRMSHLVLAIGRLLCMVVGDLQVQPHSLLPTAPVPPTCPARPGDTAHTLPICPVSFPLRPKNHPSGDWSLPLFVGNARPSPPQSLPALQPLIWVPRST